MISLPEGFASSGIARFDHVGIAVRDLERAVTTFRDLMGGVLVMGGDDIRLGLRTIMFKLPVSFKIELLWPMHDESYIARYIEKKGEGFHHATIFVDDVEAKIAEMLALDYELVDTDLSQPTWRETFIRPKSGHGCLFQFVDSTLDNWLTPNPDVTIEAILGGEWRWFRNQTWHVSNLPSDYGSDKRPVTFKGGG